MPHTELARQLLSTAGGIILAALIITIHQWRLARRERRAWNRELERMFEEFEKRQQEMERIQ